ncbi:uncharacterized protein [Battus philenor]|uniref:uncharacterized protein n=1 Tax=Battus philenor TaxID=42288 RepID=UPI0035CEA2AF
MGWTGSTFRNYRCWYVAVFPPPLLIIVSLIVISVIITVCVLYLIILHSAVRTVNRIRESQENHTISYINEAFNCDEHANSAADEMPTTITITISHTGTESAEKSLQVRELAVVSSNRLISRNKLKEKNFRPNISLSKSTTANHHPSKIKAVKTVLLILLCFVGTWTPYYVAIIIYVKCDITKNGYDCVPLEILTLGPLYLLGMTPTLNHAREALLEFLPPLLPVLLLSEPTEH